MEVILGLLAAVVMAIDEGSPGLALLLFAALVGFIILVCTNLT